MREFKKIILMFVFIFSLTTLIGCADDISEETEETVVVTFYDGTEVIKTEEVTSGSNAVEYTPSKDGYDFVGWFATPSMGIYFDFTNSLTEDTSIFGGFTTYQEDTREYYIVGSGIGSELLSSNWGNYIDETHELVKNETSNTYTITLDLYADDEFQFVTDSSWSNKRGYGYLETNYLEDGTEAFTGFGGLGETSSKGLNIKVVTEGNYTLTLTTYPAEDYYDTENAYYTEEGKNVYNIGVFDKITFVYNGDVVNSIESVTTYYIKGAGITSWNNMYNSSTMFTNNNGVHTLTIDLNAGEEFLMTTLVTVGSTTTVGVTYVRYTNLDETSQALFSSSSSSNLITIDEGNYTFTYNEETSVLSVSMSDITAVESDYYIDGTFADAGDWSGYCFNANYQLTDVNNDGVYEISNITFKADSQFIIQAFTAGAIERGTWGTDTYTGLGSYNFTYVYNAGENFEAVSSTNYNIHIINEGTYDITFDSYSKIITISESE